MQDILAKLHKKVRFPSLIFKYTKKYDFDIQHLTHLFKKKWLLCNFWENGEPVFQLGYYNRKLVNFSVFVTRHVIKNLLSWSGGAQ